MHRSQIPRNRGGTDGATALGKEVGLLVDKLIKQAILNTKQKSENGYVQTDNL